jgi:hypothetical protein
MLSIQLNLIIEHLKISLAIKQHYALSLDFHNSMIFSAQPSAAYNRFSPSSRDAL